MTDKLLLSCKIYLRIHENSENTTANEWINHQVFSPLWILKWINLLCITQWRLPLESQRINSCLWGSKKMLLCSLLLCYNFYQAEARKIFSYYSYKANSKVYFEPQAFKIKMTFNCLKCSMITVLNSVQLDRRFLYYTLFQALENKVGRK